MIVFNLKHFTIYYGRIQWSTTVPQYEHPNALRMEEQVRAQVVHLEALPDLTRAVRMFINMSDHDANYDPSLASVEVQREAEVAGQDTYSYVLGIAKAALDKAGIGTATSDPVAEFKLHPDILEALQSIIFHTDPNGLDGSYRFDSSDDACDYVFEKASKLLAKVTPKGE